MLQTSPIKRLLRILLVAAVICVATLALYHAIILPRLKNEPLMFFVAEGWSAVAFAACASLAVALVIVLLIDTRNEGRPLLHPSWARLLTATFIALTIPFGIMTWFPMWSGLLLYTAFFHGQVAWPQTFLPVIFWPLCYLITCTIDASSLRGGSKFASFVLVMAGIYSGCVLLTGVLNGF